MSPESRIFQRLDLENTVYATSTHFKNIDYLEYFAILLDKNIIVDNDK